MTKTFDEVSAAIPLRTFALILRERGLAKEQNFPADYDGPNIEWKGQRIWRNRVVNRLLTHEKGIECMDVIICRLREMVVGKGGIELTAVAINAFVHRALESRFGP